jgi:sigma-B regulation protein RsbU (phosphoserine phosphatase)
MMEQRARILIVDDEPLNVDYLEQELEDFDCETSSAANGREALEQVAAQGPDVILLDIMMPEMDGFEVLTRLKADRALREIPVIIISALDDMGSIVKGIEMGAEDYLPKPSDPVLLRARIGACLEKKRLRDREVLYLRRINRELDLAWQIQAGFLPPDMPDIPGWQMAAKLKPSRETSGDFYDLFRLPKGQLGILVADVVDKGMGAALFMVLSRTLIRTYAGEYRTEPDLVFGATNRRILADTDTDQFVTVFYGILDTGTGKLTYCNAGHNPPYLFSGSTKEEMQALGQTGPPLGILEGVAWKKKSVRLSPGDVLVLYSDGITEAQNKEGAFYGEERLQKAARAALTRPAQGIEDEIMSDVRGFVADAPQQDDIALVVVTRDSATVGAE